MKNSLHKLIFILISLGAIFTGCSSDGGDSDSAGGSSLQGGVVKEGKISSVSAPLLGATEVSKTIDANKEDFIIYYYRKDADYADWGIWLWKEGGDGEPAFKATENKATVTEGNNTTIAYWNISELCSSNADLMTSINNKEKIGIIITIGPWTKKENSSDIYLNLSEGNHFMILEGDKTPYTVEDKYDAKIKMAVAQDDLKKIKVGLNVKLGLSTKAGNNGFILSDSEGNSAAIVDVLNFNAQNNRNNNFADTLLVVLENDLDVTKDWYIKNDKFIPEDGLVVDNHIAVKKQFSEYRYEGNDLGLTLDGTTGKFKTWAPVASSINILLYTTNVFTTEAKKVPMTKGENGIWTAETDVSAYKYYIYEITNQGVTNKVCDIHAKAASANSVAAQITDINTDATAIPTKYEHDTTYGTKEGYYNPFGNSGNVIKKYTDAVIYEMHVRDWSQLETDYASKDSRYTRGRYMAIADGNKVIEHVKSMGVTHVQILPVFDFAEKNTDKNYNWGYNPYHYNVPEGRYVSTGYKDGTQAVFELRSMIAAFHDAGISVNMDVVYNHTSGTGEYSLYDMTVPYYFYDVDENGGYYNGSGCGNEIDSAAPMVRKYIVESLKHWMLDYHFNGFRFDLMGLIDTETMKEVYEELSKIDPNVMVYGEPWTGGTSAVKHGSTANNLLGLLPDNVNGIGYFGDVFRNAVKGAEYPSFTEGQVSQVDNTAAINKGLKGSSSVIGRHLNYVECHDNLTLADKITMCLLGIKSSKDVSLIGTPESQGRIYKEENYSTGVTIGNLKLEDELAAAYVFLAQGTPFINGGQEFLRSKYGDENSYKSNDTINGIKQSYIDAYSDVTDYYRGLIALRKAYPESFGANENATAVTKRLDANGKEFDLVSRYETGDFVIYFNASKSTYNLPESDFVEGYEVDLSSGVPSISSEKTTLKAASMLSATIYKIK